MWCVLPSFFECSIPKDPFPDETACRLPNCRCASPSIPGDLSLEDTPQFVVVTIDDALNDGVWLDGLEHIFQDLTARYCPAE